MATEAVIWDMDGVIADTGRHHFLAWQALTNENGIPFDEEDFRRGFGRRNPEILTELFGRELSAEEISRFSLRKEELFRRLIKGNVRAFPGALELLRALPANGFKQALATSTPVENVDLVLRSLAIVDCFGAIVADKDVKKGKPHPQAFLLAAERLQEPPSRCLVIEDAVDGVRAAKSAGMKCIAVTNTHPREKLDQADMVANSLAAVHVETIRDLLHERGRKWTR